ncbi:MAG: DNA polymerase III subunit alpha [Proteobacteria bacterium]|nr:DNA polymerase III subunit alpha [Pseudomonadota bacterium]
MFIHLRAHSSYSLLEGAIKTDDLVALAKAEGIPALALTDTNNMFGALEFATAAAEEGIQPIIGALLALREGGQHKNEPQKTFLPLLAKDETGYRNLMALTSLAWLSTAEEHEAFIALKHLEEHAEGLIVFTGGPAGPIGQLLIDSQEDAAEALLLRLKALFPGRLYVEIQRHGEGEIGDKEQRTENAFLDLAYKHELPLIATNDVMFADQGMFEAHDALLCIAAKGHYVSETDRPRVTRQHYFKSPAEMRALFSDLPEAVDNTLVVARRCAFWPVKSDPILPPFAAASGRNEAEELKAQAEEGLEERFARNPRITNQKEYRDRLQYELDVIIPMGFAGYFLIVADFIKWAKARNIPVGPGRGSGVGSLVAWALTITDLDPIPLNLLFERFLNPERISMPDFDLDFCQERRDEVIAYVQQRYGADKVAQIITFGKLQARAVLRNVGRVLGMPLGYVDKICKLVPFNPANPVSLEDAINGEPALQTMRDADPAVARLIDISLKLEGLYAHASTHAAGLVIGDRPLQQIVPLYRDPRSPLPVTQFNMKTVEQAGLVKFDFLGLTTLSILQLACRMLEQKGITVDLSVLTVDDKDTYAMLSRGETLGVFQLEGAGMRDTLRRMKPTRFEDIIALVALYRPGPMDNIPKYIKVKNGEERPDYLHPMLEPILRETYGIAIYQEQVMQIAQVLSGFTLGAADLLRRAMGKKIREEMAAQRKNFVAGAVKKGVDADQAEMIFEQVDKFAGYGFNKSHAAAYALIAYHTAYMKAHHPQAFYAASMTFAMNSTDKLNVFRQELLRLGIPLLPPDINRSTDVFALEETNGREGIRYALSAIKGVGQEAMKSLVKEREEKGAFADLFDFAGRLDSKVINKRQMENLACAGAFDALEANRACLMENVEMLVKLSGHSTQERQSGQVSLFADAPQQTVKPQLREAAPWEDLLRLQKEFGALGFYLSSHPLDAFRPLLERLGVVRAAQLSSVAGGTGSVRRKVAGIMVSKQERTAKSGNRFAFVQLSDTSGMFEAMVFSEVLSSKRELLVAGTPLLLSVDVQGTPQEYRLTVQQVERLDEVASRESQGVMLVLAGERGLKPVAELAAKLPRGKSRIHLLIDVDGEDDAEIALPGTYAFSSDLRSKLKGLDGVLAAQDL